MCLDIVNVPLCSSVLLIKGKCINWERTQITIPFWNCTWIICYLNFLLAACCVIEATTFWVYPVSPSCCSLIVACARCVNFTLPL
jgi:hypothetical protein